MPHSASCLSTSGVCAPVGGSKKTTSASCNKWHHHQCKEGLRRWLKEKRHQRKLEAVTTTMCASRVLALVDRRVTPQVQDAKVSAQDVRSGPTSAQVSRDAAATFNYNHHHHHRQCKMQQVAPPQVQGVFAPMAEGKTPPAQVAGSDHHHVCKWSTCAGWWKDNTTSARCKGQCTRCKVRTNISASQ